MDPETPVSRYQPIQPWPVLLFDENVKPLSATDGNLENFIFHSPGTLKDGEAALSCLCAKRHCRMGGMVISQSLEIMNHHKHILS